MTISQGEDVFLSVTGGNADWYRIRRGVGIYRVATNIYRIRVYASSSVGGDLFCAYNDDEPVSNNQFGIFRLIIRGRFAL